MESRHAFGTHLQRGVSALDSMFPFRFDAFLEANSDAYEWLVGDIKARAHSMTKEGLLCRIQDAARFATASHSGRFADGTIENLALEIGAELDSAAMGDRNFSPRLSSIKGVRRVLHVTDQVLGIGGHTRMLMHWIRDDRTSSHTVLLLDQKAHLPAWFHGTVSAVGGSIIALPSRAPIWKKALWLRCAARHNADLVVLHHFGPNVAPTVAFARRDGPPVAVLNHADHLFWLGSSVADLVINLRSVAVNHTRQRRFVPRNAVLPVPLTDDAPGMLKTDARFALGIPNDHLVLLSVGRAEKYRPCGGYDFLGTAGKILDHDPRARIYVVGEKAERIAPYVRGPIHQNLNFVGELEDPTMYRNAADIYLESFPFGSQTALLEAALAGLPVVPAYAPLNPLLVANDDALVSALPNPLDEREYIERAVLLMRKPDLRPLAGEELRKQLLVDHVGEGWLNRLSEIYRQTDILEHLPKPIPVSSCCTSDEDVGLSLWQAMSRPIPLIGTTLDTDRATGRYVMFARLNVGDYRAARRIVLGHLRRTPFHRSSWHLLAATLKAHAGAGFRRLKAWLRSAADSSIKPMPRWW